MELEKYLNAVFKRLWLVILMLITAAVISAFIAVFIMDPVYESNTTLYIVKNSMDPKLSITYNDILANKHLVKDYRELIKSRTITNAVIKELGLTGISPESLADEISVNLKNDTRIIEIKVRDKNPILVGEVADATAEVFAQKVKELLNIENVNIIDKAQLPGYRIGPNISLIITAGAFLGLLTALGIVLLIEFRDDTLITVKDIGTQIDLPVLGTLPWHIP